MTRHEYRGALKALGISQVRAAKLFGVNPRTSRHWALGERPIPYYVELILAIMLKADLTAEEVDAVLPYDFPRDDQ